jgi:hypothetical protein
VPLRSHLPHPLAHNSSESDTSDAEDAELETWRYNRRHFNAEQGAPVKCNRLNMVTHHQVCQSCEFPRFDDEEEQAILPPPPQTQSNSKGSVRLAKVSSKGGKKASKSKYQGCGGESGKAEARSPGGRLQVH